MITGLVGELEDIRWASAERAIASARANPDLIVGIKVRLGHQMVGSDPAPVMRLAREAADALDLPLMVHVIDMRPPISWLLPYLGRGDVVTHCYPGNEPVPPARNQRSSRRGDKAAERARPGIRATEGELCR
jgi:dihydroorotase